jgi:hypothetical protein
VQRVDADPGYDAAVTGEWTADADFSRLSQDDLREGELLFGAPAALLILLLVFGTVVAGLLLLLMAIVSIVIALALTALLGQAFELSIFVVNMLTGMGLALGIDYTLFILSRYREERAEGREKLAAIAVAGATASRAVLFSGIAFVLAMFGLVLVPSSIFRSLAAGAILVALVSMVAALTLVPAFLSLLGDRMNALRVPFFGRVAHRSSSEGRFWGAIARAVMGRPAGQPRALGGRHGRVDLLRREGLDPEAERLHAGVSGLRGQQGRLRRHQVPAREREVHDPRRPAERRGRRDDADALRRPRRRGGGIPDGRRVRLGRHVRPRPERPPLVPRRARPSRGRDGGRRRLGTSTWCSVRVSVRRPDGSMLVFATFVGSKGGFLDTEELPVAGTYVVFVDPQDTDTGSVRPTLHDVPPDAGGLLSLGGSPVTARMTVPGQNASLTFSGAAGQRATLRLSGVTVGASSCCSLRLSVLKPDGTRLFYPLFVGRNGATASLSLPASGTYTVGLDPQKAETGHVTVALAPT